MPVKSNNEEKAQCGAEQLMLMSRQPWAIRRSAAFTSGSVSLRSEQLGVQSAEPVTVGHIR